MTKAEAKLAAYLLKLAALQFSHHGCNDLDLVKEVGLTPEESLALRRAARTQGGDPLAPEERMDRHLTDDWRMMDLLAKRFEDEAL